MAKMMVPLGPQHPALEEPESFNLLLEGERVAAANVALGYNHRGMEKAAESRTYIQNIHLLERICGICSHTHSTCYVQAVESIAGVEVPKRALYLRALIGEMERVHSHLLWLGIAGHEIGFMSLFMYAWKDREIIMDMLEMLTGNRINYGMNCLGGVRQDIDATHIDEILKAVDMLEERTKYYAETVLNEQTVILRLSGVGFLSKEDALRFGAVGPVLRASGVKRDIRRDDNPGIYDELDFDVITDDHQDVHGRTVVRVNELLQSYRMIRQILTKIPEGPLSVRVPARIPAGEGIGRHEAPRGENVHYVRANGTDKPDRVKVRAATLANLAAITHMIEGGYLADVPIIIAAIDPCFSCTDRMLRVNHESGASDLFNWEKLRLQGIEWYKDRGIDLSALKAVKKGDI